MTKCADGGLARFDDFGSGPSGGLPEGGTGVSAIGPAAFMSGERCRSLWPLMDRKRGIGRGYRAGVALANPHVPMQTSSSGDAKSLWVTHILHGQRVIRARASKVAAGGAWSGRLRGKGAFVRQEQALGELGCRIPRSTAKGEEWP